jgi:hypothetical protein
MCTGFGARLEWAVGTAHCAGRIELIAGDPAAAERQLRLGCEELRAMGERGYLSLAMVYLAEALYAQGRYAEALPLTEEAEALAAPDDIQSRGHRGVQRPATEPGPGGHCHSPGRLLQEAPTRTTLSVTRAKVPIHLSRLIGATSGPMTLGN